MPFIERYLTWILGATLIALTALAFSNRFVMDDAFISFRYAENLVAGHGLVFNPGEAVEGYTNFLWTILMAIPFVIGVDPVPFSQALGLACFLAALVFTFRLAARLMASRIYGLLTVVLVGTNFSFSAYATGGLETMLQALLITLCFDLALRPERSAGVRARDDAAFSIACALALLTRLDSVILVFPAALLRVLSILSCRAARSNREIAFQLAALVLPVAVLLGAWAAWKLSFYGALIPNTFAAKVSDVIVVERGLYYIGVFLVSYLLVPFFLAAPFAFLRSVRERNFAMLALLCGLVCWGTYIAWVGGDFMEFRFMVPALPLAFVAITWIVVTFITHRLARPAAFAFVVVGSLHHALTFGADAKPESRVDRIIESVGMLNSHIDQDDWNWRGIGRVLGQAFAGQRDITIATTAAGTIPFYAKIPAIDMHGLCDRFIAQNGVRTSGNVGHRRVATLSYLMKRNVNLVFGHPWLVPNRAKRPKVAQIWVPAFARDFVHFEDGDRLPPRAHIVEIPISAAWSVAALYLTRHPAVDAAIAKNGWVAFGR